MTTLGHLMSQRLVPVGRVTVNMMLPCWWILTLFERFRYNKELSSCDFPKWWSLLIKVQRWLTNRERKQEKLILIDAWKHKTKADPSFSSTWISYRSWRHLGKEFTWCRHIHAPLLKFYYFFIEIIMYRPIYMFLKHFCANFLV